jgi:hypothetical protein
MKCAHPENKGNDCDFDSCPRSGYEGDWKTMTTDNDYLCHYRRSDKWFPKIKDSVVPKPTEVTK